MPIQSGDVGTRMGVRVFSQGDPLDISTATAKKIVLIKPDKTVVEYDATFTTDGSDGRMYYPTVSGDIATVGTWYIRAWLSMPTWTGYTSKRPFTVASAPEA